MIRGPSLYGHIVYNDFITAWSLAVISSAIVAKVGF